MPDNEYIQGICDTVYDHFKGAMMCAAREIVMNDMSYSEADRYLSAIVEK